MPMIDAFLAELQHEAATTRRLLERVPEDRMGWKPHERSMTLARLAGHVAELPAWSRTILADDEFEIEKARERGFTAHQPATVAELLRVHDDSVAAYRAAAAGVSDDTLRGRWRMLKGGKVALEMPRAVGLRSFVMNHLIHHRGQLSVYLRLLGVPLPSIYGPTADDPGPFG
jgi:uncharacterized damage-inducible protein DinB